MSDKVRAAVYARISDDRTGDELGVTRQLKAGRELVAQRSGTVVLERADDDISATYGARRPGYDDVLHAAEQGEITHIVAFQQSRLWRNRRERADGIERLSKARVGIILIKGNDIDLTTAAGRAMAGLLGEFDTMESEVKSERQLAKVAELVAEGKIGNGGPRPFGYRRIFAGEGPRRKILRDEIEPAEAEIIREMADRFLAGESLRSLVGDMNRRGIPTSTGRRWTMPALRWMLRSGRIAGLREHKGVITGPAVWPAIVDHDTHELLRTKLDSGRRPPGSRVRIHYLAGFVRCGKCDAVMRVGPQHGELKLKCPPKQEGGCNGRVIVLAPLRDLVDLYMIRRMSDPETLRQLAAREAEHDTRSGELLAAIEADERRLERLRVELVDGDADIPELAGAVRTVRKRIVESRGKLAEISQTPEVTRLDLPELARRWQGLHIDQKRTLVRLFVDKILIGPGQPGRRTFDPGRVDIFPR